LRDHRYFAALDHETVLVPGSALGRLFFFWGWTGIRHPVSKTLSATGCNPVLIAN
jgi:hypothetical protein